MERQPHAVRHHLRGIADPASRDRRPAMAWAERPRLVKQIKRIEAAIDAAPPDDAELLDLYATHAVALDLLRHGDSLIARKGRMRKRRAGGRLIPLYTSSARAPRRTSCSSGRPAARRTAVKGSRAGPDDDDGPGEPARPR